MLGYKRKRYDNARFSKVNATATRALVGSVHGDLPRIEVTMTMDDSQERITFELTVNEAGKLIEQMMAAYNAIMPPLKTSRGGFGL